MFRVKDLDQSIRFYQEALGMNLLSRVDYPGGEFTLAFLSHGTSTQDPCLELTYNWGRSEYELGDAFGHIAFAVDDAAAACDRARAVGAKVTREAGPMKHGSTVIAFIEDPNGYKVELIQSSRG